MFVRRGICAVLLILGAVGPVPMITAEPAGAATSSPGSFVRLSQGELLDTTTGYGAPRVRVGPRASVTMQLLGRGGVPTTGASAVRVNVTALNSSAAGSVVIAGEPVVSYVGGGVATNGAIVTPGPGGRILITNISTGAVDIRVSALGYYRSGTVTQAGMFQSTGYIHLLNTTTGAGAPRRLLGRGGVITLTVAGHARVPATGASAVVLNLAGFDATALGTAVAYTANGAVPPTSSLPYRPGVATRVLVTVPLASDGTIKIYNRGPGALNLTADVEGYYRTGTPLGAGSLVNRAPAVSQYSPLSIVPGGTVTTNLGAYFGDSPDLTYQLGVSVADAAHSGWIGVWTSGMPHPTVPTFGFTAGAPSFAELPVGASSYNVTLHNFASVPVRVTLDERGFFGDGTLGAITGVVKDSAGHPMAGVRVGFGDDNSAAQNAASTPAYVTGANGTYQIAGLPAGSYAVCFNPAHVTSPLSSTGYQARCYNQESAGADDVAVSAGQVVSGIDAALPNGGAFTGHVTDTAGHPLAGIQVQVQPGGNLSWSPDPVTSRADGSFRFNGLDTGQFYSICTLTGLSTSAGTAPAGYIGACSPDSPQPTTTPTDTGTIAMRPAVGISGTVTDNYGHPLANVGVGYGVGTSGYNWPSASTDSHGHYTITGIDPGTPPYTAPVYVCFQTHTGYTTVTGGASATGYVDQCYNNQLPDPSTSLPKSTPISPTPGAIATHIDGHLLPAAAVTGTVTNGAGHPLSGITVEVVTSPYTSTTRWQSTTTTSTGTYRVSGLQPGTYSVCFVPDMGLPLPPPSGYLSQCWQNQAFRGAPQNLRLWYNQTATHIDATLNAGGTITGVATDSTGHPVEGVRVLVDNQIRATTDASGDYTISYVDPGNRTVCFDASSATGGTSTTGYQSQCWNAQPYGTPGTAVPVTVGHVTSGINPSLPAAGGIIVHVTDASGNPLVGAVPYTFFGDNLTNSTVYSATDANGNYTITHLANGQYNVCVSTGGISGGTSTTGYQPRCYGQTNSMPVTPPPVTVNGNTVSITIALPAA